MEEKEITIGNKTYKIKEIKYKDVTEFTTENPSTTAKRLIQLGTEITDEEYDNLPMREGIELTKAINEFNGIDENFMASQAKSKTS